MGEEGSGEHDSSGYDSTSSSDTSSTATQDPWAAQDPHASHDAGAVLDPEAALSQAGQFYSNGDFPGAIHAVQAIYDARAYDATWGRAAYGMVMCYDKLNDFDNAGRIMREVVRHVISNGWDPTQYQEQLNGYVSGGHGWTGDFLLY